LFGIAGVWFGEFSVDDSGSGSLYSGVNSGESEDGSIDEVSLAEDAEERMSGETGDESW